MLPSQIKRSPQLVDYMLAVQNEIIIDVEHYRLSGLNPRDFGCFPRPTKWANKSRLFISLFKSVARLSKLIWICGGFLLFHFCEFVRFYTYLQRQEQCLSDLQKNASFGIAFSSRAFEIIREPVVDSAPACWISMPWAPIERTNSESGVVDVFAFLTGRDLFAAFWLSILATLLILCRPRVAGWSMETYTAFRWFAVRRALDKLKGNFYIAEHCDRWAVLADSAIHRGNKVLRESRSELHLVQHGHVGEGEADVHSFSLALKYKLKSVTNLYVYEAASEGVFKARILSRSCGRSGVRVKYFVPEIRLSKSLEIKRSILFVGHPVCEKFQVQLYHLLRQDHNITFYYKPHPAAAGSELVRSQDWVFILENSFFPKVDMLISYPSTLVAEYRAKNIPAFVHSMEPIQEELLTICESIQQGFPAIFNDR